MLFEGPVQTVHYTFCRPEQQPWCSPPLSAPPPQTRPWVSLLPSVDGPRWLGSPPAFLRGPSCFLLVGFLQSHGYIFLVRPPECWVFRPLSKEPASQDLLGTILGHMFQWICSFPLPVKPHPPRFPLPVWQPAYGPWKFDERQTEQTECLPFTLFLPLGGRELKRLWMFHFKKICSDSLEV